jgi:hypothetical protein
MEDSDIRDCILILAEIIHEQGEVVFSLSWDSGNFSAGAGADCIYKYRDYFWRYDDFGLAGPFSDFEEALWEDYIPVTSATERINCSEWPMEKLIQKLEPFDREKDLDILINGQKWRISPDGNLICKELRLVK